MFLVLGLLVVVGSVAGGYLLHGGHLGVLNQPSEFLIIGGAALGGMLIGAPPKVLKRLLSQLTGLLGRGAAKADYLELLSMLYQLFKVVQQSGIMAVESHAEAPEQSPILSKYPKFLARHHAVDFLTDSLKVMLLGGIAPHDLETLMDEDLDVHHRECGKPAAVMGKVADALPGLGIVAAVLGIVITMGAIDGPAAEIGHKVAAALVGTFLGVLLCYGFAQPIAMSLEHRAAEEGHYTLCIKAALLALHKGMPPAIAVEFARRVLPEDLRPSFEETENACKGSRPEAIAA